MAPKSDSRQRMLAAAVSLIQRQGYHATGMKQVVQESNTPRGSLYFHFPDGKDQMVEEAVDIANDHVRSVIGRVAGMKGGAPDPARAEVVSSLWQPVASTAIAASRRLWASAVESVGSLTTERSGSPVYLKTTSMIAPMRVEMIARLQPKTERS